MHCNHTRILVYSAVVLLAALGAVGCAASDTEPIWPEPRALGRGIQTFRPAAEAATTPVAVEEPTGDLTLRGALALALARNPSMAAASWTVRAAEARALQEGLMPNPEVRVRLEDFGGTSNSEQGIRLSQVIELGGKAANRRRAARGEAAVRGWDYETTRLDVFTETTQAFVAVLAAQQRVAAAGEMHDVAERLLPLITKQHRGGVKVYLDQEEARIELGTSRIELERAKHALTAARGVLVSHWDQRTPKFETAVGDLSDVSPTPIPTREQLLARIQSNPDLSRWEAEGRMRQAVLEREKANGIPDVRVLLDARRREDSGDYGYSGALEVSVPLFDRNQGSIREARAKVARAGYQRRAALMAATAAVGEAHQSLAISQREATLLSNDVIPAAQRAMEITRKAIERGEMTKMQLLKAQRTLFKAQSRQIDALEDFHRSLADLECLIGQPIGRSPRPATVETTP